MGMPDLEAKGKLGMTALGAAIYMDGDAIDAAMEELYAYRDWPTLYGICCGWITAMHHAVPVPGDGDFIGLEVVDIRTGRQHSMAEVDLPRDLKTAAQLVAAIGNGDFKAGSALFFAAVDAGEANDTIACVLALTSSAIAHAKGIERPA